MTLYPRRVLFITTGVRTSNPTSINLADILIINLITLFFAHEESEVMNRSFILHSCTSLSVFSVLCIFCQKNTQVNFIQTTHFKSVVFWDITPELAISSHAAILFGLFFDPEDGDDMFLRNVG
jgi:hypothetical protein